MKSEVIIALIILLVFATILLVACCITYYADSLVNNVDSTIRYTQINQDENL